MSPSVINWRCGGGQAAAPGSAALIAKIGGSTAGTGDGTMFLVGRSCIYELDQGKRGPLYLTINDETAGMANNNGKLAVTISIKPNAEPPGGEPKAVTEPKK